MSKPLQVRLQEEVARNRRVAECIDSPQYRNAALLEEAIARIQELEDDKLVDLSKKGAR